jgi:phosphatidate phosphatase APP1
MVCAASVAVADTSSVRIEDGFGRATRVAIEGRIAESRQQTDGKAGDSGFTNFWRNLRLMFVSERERASTTLSIHRQTITATSDEEGYFRLEHSSATPLPGGWLAVHPVGQGAAGSGRVLVVPETNLHGVISDVDDTVIVSDVTDKSRLLKNTFLKHPEQRSSFPGTNAFFSHLLDANAERNAAPMFYLSASPRHLAPNIKRFLDHHRFPDGVLLTKQTTGDTRDPLLDQERYKLARIEQVLAMLPWVRFTLIGDDGERDPEIYRAIAEKYPTRVAAIYIRKVHPDPARVRHDGQMDLAEAVDHFTAQ